ncbi:helix-turn-helix transcriptional regulator [Myxococcota bacterium]|nr:helix-turn-helix transcriptional regulator [Myxococcota bacterium]
MHGDRLGVDFEISADQGRGFGAGLRRTLGATAPASGILYDPTRPDRDQRNVVLTPFRDVLRGEAAVQPAMIDLATACRFEIAGQVRALVCDGPLLLAWVGGAWPVEATARATFLLRSLLPAIRQRLLVDRAFGHAPLLAAALQASLDALGVPAFLLIHRHGRDTVEMTNPAGMQAMERDPTGTRAQLAASRAALHDGMGAFRMIPVEATGCPRAMLAIARTPVDLALRVGAAATRFKLTLRQREVLGLLLLGHTNRTIGECLACTEATVEQHVTALLNKTGADTRSQLVARVWNDHAP